MRPGDRCATRTPVPNRRISVNWDRAPGSDRRSRRARAQPQGRRRRLPARPARRHHRPVSGSGKSSLAFDTIYAEGQRRYVESLSAYARQFLGQMEKPDVDQIDGLSPGDLDRPEGRSRATRDRPSARSPRSTTTCGCCSRASASRTARTATRSSARPSSRSSTRCSRCPKGTRLLVLGPLIKDRKTEGDRIFEAARKQGFVRVRVDGEQYDLAEAPTLDKYKRHTIEVVVDRYIVRRAEAPDGLGARRARPADRPGDRTSRSRIPDAAAAGRLDRDGAAPGRGRGRHRARAARRRAAGLRGAPVLRALLVPVRRHHDRRARAAQLLVQLAARRLPDLHRASARSSRSTRSCVIPDQAKSVTPGRAGAVGALPTDALVAA